MTIIYIGFLHEEMGRPSKNCLSACITRLPQLPNKSKTKDEWKYKDKYKNHDE